MIDAAPPPVAPAFVFVERADDRALLVMLGFFAFGSEADLRRLGTAAERAGVPSGPVEEADEPEHGVLFRPGVDRDAAIALYRRARDGEFGNLRVRPIVVRIEDAADGIDLDSEVKTFDSSEVGEPRP
jgi:hypothetical protein